MVWASLSCTERMAIIPARMRLAWKSAHARVSAFVHHQTRGESLNVGVISRIVLDWQSREEDRHKSLTPHGGWALVFQY